MTAYQHHKYLNDIILKSSFVYLTSIKTWLKILNGFLWFW